MKPGFYPDCDAATYHADKLTPQPSLSSSIAKVILSQTPRHAWFEHPRLNPNYEPSDDSKFDLGSVAHELLLGKGAGFEIVQANDWRSKAAQERREEARKTGAKAILQKDYDRAAFMAGYATGLLAQMGIMLRDMDRELPFFWQDGGTWCRAMADAIHCDNRLCIDIKTTGVGLTDDALARQIDNLGYDLSAGHYIRGLERLIPESAGRWRWLWVFIEADDPHELRVIQADRATLEIGDRKAATALVKWRRALESGNWHGYPLEIVTGGLTDWAIERWRVREEIDPDCAQAPFSSLARPVERKDDELIYGAG